MSEQTIGKIESGQSGHCHLPPVKPREFPAGFDPARASSIIVLGNKWVNQTVLRYSFVEDPPHASDADVVRSAFQEWEELPIGLSFTEVADPGEAEIRIGFDQADGSWSYVGRQVLNRPIDQPTMNFGWRLSLSDYGRDTALHEIGHTLGLPHEHQNPNAGIVWNERTVYDYFQGPPNNWSSEQVEWNILRKLDADSVRGSAWDRDSIMHYQFEAGLISVPALYKVEPLVPASGLSETDIEWVQQFYPGTEDRPGILEPFQSQPLGLAPGEQADFLVRPSNTRNYTFETIGDADVVMVLFENVEATENTESGLRYVVGDDDSGADRNARFETKLFKGREYVLRLRLYWAWAKGQTAVSMS